MSRVSLCSDEKWKTSEIVLMVVQHCEWKCHRTVYTMSKRVYFMFLYSIYINPPSHTHTHKPSVLPPQGLCTCWPYSPLILRKCFPQNNFLGKATPDQSRPTLCNPVDCSLPGSSDHGVLRARILEWVAFSRGSSQPRDRTRVSRIGGRCFNL